MGLTGALRECSPNDILFPAMVPSRVFCCALFVFCFDVVMKRCIPNDILFPAMVPSRVFCCALFVFCFDVVMKCIPSDILFPAMVPSRVICCGLSVFCWDALSDVSNWLKRSKTFVAKWCNIPAWKTAGAIRYRRGIRRRNCSIGTILLLGRS